MITNTPPSVSLDFIYVEPSVSRFRFPLYRYVIINFLFILHYSELSALSIVMINEKKEVTGFIAFSDHPDILGVHPSEWENWIRNSYQRYYLSRNTLFIHFMCCTDAVKDFFIEEAFIAVFLNDYYLQYIVLSVPMFCPEELITRYLTYKKRNIYKYLPRVKEGIGDYLLTALRADFCPKLKMRRAVEEDNDDLVDILDKKCPRLKRLYGEYYISEIIGRHPESTRQIIVADIQGRAVAVMCLNTDINYKKLQKIYELRPYHGLKTATPLEREQTRRSNVLLSDFGEPIMLGKWSPFDQASRIKRHRSSDAKVKTLRQNMKNSSRVNFQARAGSMEHIIARSQSEDFSEMGDLPSPSLSASLYSVVNLLDEDPFDYEIVNIDTTLILTETRSQELFRSAISLAGKSSFEANSSFTKSSKIEARSSLQE
ncbi:cilia- and flagella-associated protein 61-like [Trichoplusia ni]|uniref:Cilia- and flagella-associated protein 61-like n=1 Tax=Trichoplusia ni TaxID=7111 RepID=A0A7E5WY84_TRINI|nr:cilia- and flagella-associated protein 61-like [Trichoplusia ni]